MIQAAGRHDEEPLESMKTALPTGLQQITLILLRTLIGWHFVWEGFVKLWWPSWSRGGWPLERWSAAGYLQTAEGPFPDFFRGLADSSWMPLLDILIAVALVLIGLSLMLGLFTQSGTLGALVMLTLFYLAHVPTLGVAVPGAEGSSLFVNKTLVEGAAVLVLLVFRTGRIAGFDLLLVHRRQKKAALAAPPPEVATEAVS
jgi:thiosulfate dehydrogenase [quinone] large subunit